MWVQKQGCIASNLGFSLSLSLCLSPSPLFIFSSFVSNPFVSHCVSSLCVPVLFSFHLPRSKRFHVPRLWSGRKRSAQKRVRELSKSGAQTLLSLLGSRPAKLKGHETTHTQDISPTLSTLVRTLFIYNVATKSVQHSSTTTMTQASSGTACCQILLT